MRKWFMETERIGFSKWENTDIILATKLWGDPQVTRFICAAGKFSEQEIFERLQLEIYNEKLFHVQYWPIFEKTTEKFIGCCGLRPFQAEKHSYEMGFHLCKEYWGKGYALEAANAVIIHSFRTLNADKLHAGHNPRNEASKKLLMKLGFEYVGNQYYEPTGLEHPSYELIKKEVQI